jgi:hypothetical protein
LKGKHHPDLPLDGATFQEFRPTWQPGSDNSSGAISASRVVNQAAPDFQVTTIDGNKLSLADFKGQHGPYAGAALGGDLRLVNLSR